MVGENRWVDVKVGVFAVPLGNGAKLVVTPHGPVVAEATDSIELARAVPHFAQPGIVSCEYKDIRAICGLQRNGQHAAMEILELTGFCDTPEGLPLRQVFPASPARAQPYATPEVYTTSAAAQCKGVSPGGFSKVSVIDHSLGGLINIYGLGFIEDVTKGAFFKKIQPIHYIAMAFPLLGIWFERSWFLKHLLAHGFLGQTGTDLSVEDCPPAFSSQPSKKKDAQTGPLPPVIAIETSLENDTTVPLMITMSRPGSVCNRIPKQFLNQATCTNLENDRAVRLMTSSMKGISGFDEKALLDKEPSMRKEN
ncbi:hypothetical protein BGW39_000983 [Mortierella sp. 14UC]|nr:hypothetical protein BGW39_000983 [Mortierella sp. 14UC]